MVRYLLSDGFLESEFLKQLTVTKRYFIDFNQINFCVTQWPTKVKIVYNIV